MIKLLHLMSVTPELVAPEDENGNDLVYLGLLTETGFQTPTETFTRNKGKSKAIPITGLLIGPERFVISKCLQSIWVSHTIISYLGANRS